MAILLFFIQSINWKLFVSGGSYITIKIYIQILTTASGMNDRHELSYQSGGVALVDMSLLA